MDLISTVLVTLLTSSVVLGLMVLAVRKYMVAAISHEFQKRAEIEKLELEKLRVRDSSFFESRMSLYPELSEIVYRLKGAIQQAANAEQAIEGNGDLIRFTGHLTEFLYRNTFYIPEPLFNALHDYKRLAQNSLVLMDICTREENIFDKAVFALHKPALLENLALAIPLYENIQIQLKALEKRP